VPHLIGGRRIGDDIVLPEAGVADLLGAEVVVEEKLDGANVALWPGDAGGIVCSLRSGPGAMDRAGQLGPLRAWAAAHDHVLRTALESWSALYAEWLLVSHTVAYDRLPSYLVVLDLWRAPDGFAGPDERDRTCRAAGLTTPPELWRGVPGTVGAVEALVGPSRWGGSEMEGMVVRRRGPGAPRMAKLRGPAFDRIDDRMWQAGRPRNRLAEGEVSWR
jgi:hypothetical protein